MAHAPQNNGPDAADALAGQAVTRVIDAIEVCAAALEQAGVCFGHGTDNAWDEAVQLVLAAAGIPAHAGAEVATQTLLPAQRACVQRLLARRVSEREPLPYLLGEAWFAGLRFRCDRRALVPRSPLAELLLCHYRPWYTGPEPARLLDLCCGGGSLGIAAAVLAPGLKVSLADIDPEALALAQENIALHQVNERVSCVRSDLFDALGEQRFDIILCNPPYVDAQDLAAMPEEYRAEPLHALAAGADGLDLARRVLAGAANFLAPQGLLLLEVGNSWEALERAYPRVPFTWVELAEGGHGVLAMQAVELQQYATMLGGDG